MSAPSADHPLESFFWPKSIAVLGASPDHTRIRGMLLHHLVRNRFPGAVLPINPSYTEIDGIPCYPTLAATGQCVDLALMAIPAPLVPDAVEDCAANGVKHVIIISSGFAEEGAAASDLQARLVEISRRTGIRIAGPNCEGYYNAIGNVTTTFSPTVEFKPDEVPPERVGTKRFAVAAQSGGVGFSFFNRGRPVGLDFSYVISTGNEADLSLADFLDYMVRDDRTDAVLLFCEAIRDPARFVAAAAEARRRGKPIIAIKVGGSDAGARATASHTASLSGSATAYAAIFRRYGIIEAEDPEEAIAIAGMLASGPAPKGRRAGIITVSGGGGAWMADTLTAHGLTVPELSPALQARIRDYIPSYGSALNPVDITAQAVNTGGITKTMALFEQSGEVDMIVMVSSLANENRVSLKPEEIRPIVDRQTKPFAIWTYTLPSALGRATVAQCGIFLHVGLRGAGNALGKLAAYGEALALTAPEPYLVDPEAALPADLPMVLTEHRVKAVLAGYGLPPGRDRLAGSAQEAAAAAGELGFPVALKIQSPDIPHKTEAGGVRLDLRSDAEVRAAYTDILAAAHGYRADADIEGVLVQRMAPAGREFVVGVLDDPTFGPIVMAGFGGVTVELFHDVAHAPAPVDPAQAAAMIMGLKSAKLVQGFRGAKPIDIAPLADFISRVSHAALDHRARIREMEFNPVILHNDGSGITVADALITLKPDIALKPDKETHP